jgi:hypothetical protein
MDDGAARHVDVGFGGVVAHDARLEHEVWTILDSLRFAPLP